MLMFLFLLFFFLFLAPVCGERQRVEEGLSLRAGLAGGVDHWVRAPGAR
jgi:hypothetical protein